jgi:protein TonB
VQQNPGVQKIRESARPGGRPAILSRRSAFWLGLLLSLIAHAVLLGVLTLMIRPPLRRPSRNSQLIYLLYTPAPQSGSAPAAGAPSPPPIAATKHTAPPRKVAKLHSKPKPLRLSAARIPKPDYAPPSSAPVVARLEVIPGIASGRGGKAPGNGRGAAGGTGAGPGNGSSGSLLSADQVANPPVLISRVMPMYPLQARARGLRGEVVLRAIVGSDGRVEKDIVIAQSSPMFDQPAVEALRLWRFEPGRDRDGNPVRVLLEVPIRFQLR